MHENTFSVFLKRHGPLQFTASSLFDVTVLLCDHSVQLPAEEERTFLYGDIVNTLDVFLWFAFYIMYILRYVKRENS